MNAYLRVITRNYICIFIEFPLGTGPLSARGWVILLLFIVQLR